MLFFSYFCSLHFCCVFAEFWFVVCCFFFVGNLTRLFIHSQLTVTHAFVLPAALATTTNQQQEEQQLGDINFYFVVVLLQTKHFCRGQHQQQEQQLHARGEKRQALLLQQQEKRHQQIAHTVVLSRSNQRSSRLAAVQSVANCISLYLCFAL